MKVVTPMGRQGGFTLIELVTVIVILGILSAFAIPRFAGLDAEARVASGKALEGSLRSASALAHSLYLAKGTAPSSVSVEGVSIALAYGYPTVAGIKNMLQSIDGYGESSGVYTVTGAADTSTCKVTYVEATSLTVPPTITPTLSSTGCG